MCLECMRAWCRIDTDTGLYQYFRRRVERYHLKRVWAQDGWHLWSRWLHKLLSHTIAVLLCQQAGLPPLRFAQLVTAQTRTPG
jgi:hypothetical protein